jgi:flagellar protein FliO/FliZ
MDVTESLLQVAVALGATIALVLACAFVARRLMGGVQGGSDQIRILAVKALGTRERLVLVEVGGEVTLLGVSQQGITALREVHGEIIRETPTQPRFADTLARLMNRSA